MNEDLITDRLIVLLTGGVIIFTIWLFRSQLAVVIGLLSIWVFILTLQIKHFKNEYNLAEEQLSTMKEFAVVFGEEYENMKVKLHDIQAELNKLKKKHDE